MSTIDRITPIIARMVMVVGVVTGLMSVAVTVLVSEPKLLLFTMIGVTSARYGWTVAHRSHQAETLDPAAKVHPLAA